MFSSKKPANIECEVLGNHTLREVKDNHGEDNDKEYFVPIFEVRKEETTFTKGNLKLQRIVVRENDLKSVDCENHTSTIPKLLPAFEKMTDARDSKEKDNDISWMTPLRWNSNNDAPSTIQNHETKCQITNSGEKVYSATFVKKTDNVDIYFNNKDVSQQQSVSEASDSINKGTDVEFDKIYDNVVDEEVNLENIIPVVEYTENIDSEFDRLVEEYDDNKITREDEEKVKTRVVFYKQKSLQDVLPKKNERRRSLKEFIYDDEPKATIRSSKDIKYIDNIPNKDARNLVRTEDVTKPINKEPLNSEINKEEETPITSKIISDETSKSKNTKKIDTVKKSGYKEFKEPEQEIIKAQITSTNNSKVENIIPVVEYTENIDSEFDHLVEEYDENKIAREDKENVKTRVLFHKQKSLQDVLPKNNERRRSLKEFIYDDEPKATIRSLKDIKYIDNTPNKDARKLVRTEDVTKPINKEPLNSEINKDEETPIASKIISDETSKSKNTKKIDTVKKSGYKEFKEPEQEIIKSQITSTNNSNTKTVAPNHRYDTETRKDAIHTELINEDKKYITPPVVLNGNNKFQDADETKTIRKSDANNLKENPLKSKMKSIIETAAFNHKLEETTKGASNNGLVRENFSISSRIAIFENHLSKDTDNNMRPIPKPRQRENVSYILTESTTKPVVINGFMKTQATSQITEESNTEIEKHRKIYVLNHKEELHTDIDSKVDIDKESTKKSNIQNDIHEENNSGTVSRLDDAENHANVIKVLLKEGVSAKVEDYEQNKHSGSLVTNNKNQTALEDIAFPHAVGEKTSVSNESLVKMEDTQKQHIFNENQPENQIKTKHIKTSNKLLRKPVEAKNNTIIKANNKSSTNKTISVLKFGKSLNIFDNYAENRKLMDANNKLRRKSAAELDAEDKLKGKVQLMINKIKSIENLSDVKTETVKKVIIPRERPRRKSVSDKIALFEAKNLSSSKLEVRTSDI